MKSQKFSSSALALISVITLQQSHAGTNWDGGGGANTSINLADNWDGTAPGIVNSLDGTTAAVFGTGGSVATMNVDASFTKITLNGAAAFSLEGGGVGGGNLILRSVTVVSGLGDEEKVTVTEDTPSSATLTGRIKLQPATAARPGDKILQFKPGTTIKASHGFGYLGSHATLKP